MHIDQTFLTDDPIAPVCWTLSSSYHPQVHRYKASFFLPGGHFITSPRARDWVGGTKVVPGATQLHTEDPGPGPNMVRYLYSIMESDADKVVSYLDEKYSRPRILTAWARCCDTIRLL